jgi:hypothetical protein
MEHLGNSSFRERESFLLDRIETNIKHILAVQRSNIADNAKKKKKISAIPGGHWRAQSSKKTRV